MIGRLRALIYRGLLKRRVTVAPARPIVSFTFDDFPASALDVGGAILESRGVRGTYYACAGLTERPGHADLDDFRRCLERGHELADHSFTHVHCREAATPELIDQILRNRAALPEGASAHFAYPFGASDPRSEQVVARLAPTARAAVPGINVGRVPAHWLRANELYSAKGIDGLRALIEENACRRGWMIVFTHDVSETPGPHGCTPADLAAVLDAALASGAEVLTVDAAWRRIRGARAG